MADLEYVGPVTEVLIGHDGSGRSPKWHLDHVIVHNHTHDWEFLFPCNAWLDELDGQLQRRLKPSSHRPQRGEYQVTVTTGDCRGAGERPFATCRHPLSSVAVE